MPDLGDGLSVYYEMDEASGNALDSHDGSVDLTETSGTIGASATGRDFVAADTEYFTSTGHQVRLSGNKRSFSIQVCAKPDATSTQYMISDWQTTGNERCFSLILLAGTPNFRFQLSTTGALGTVVTVDSTVTVSAGTEYHILFGWDAANGEIWISVNNETRVTQSVSGFIFQSSQPLVIGARAGNLSNYDGTMRKLAMWMRTLSTSEQSELYNSGSYRDYSYISAAVTTYGTDFKVGVVQGTLPASTGTLDLTASADLAGDTAKGAFLFGNHASANDTAVAIARNCFGFTDGSLSLCTAGLVEDAASTLTDGHYDTDLAPYVLSGSGALTPDAVAAFDSWITNGIRLDVTNALSGASLINAMLFSGADCEVAVGAVAVSGALGGANWTHGMTKRPNLFILFYTGDDFDELTGHGGYLCQTIGFASDPDFVGDMQHISCTVGMRGDNDVRGDAGDFGEISTDSTAHTDPTYNGSSSDWEFAIRNLDETTARVQTTVVGSDTPGTIAIMAIHTGSIKVQPYVVTLPTSTGSKTFGDADLDPNIDFTPQALLQLVSQITAVDTFRSQSAEVGTTGISAATANAQTCATVSSDSSAAIAGTTDTQSLQSASLYSVPDDDGGATNDYAASLTEFVDGGWTANFTAVNGSAVKVAGLAFEERPSGGGGGGGSGGNSRLGLNIGLSL